MLFSDAIAFGVAQLIGVTNSIVVNSACLPAASTAPAYNYTLRYTQDHTKVEIPKTGNSTFPMDGYSELTHRHRSFQTKNISVKTVHTWVWEIQA
ncbi:hypothetical protein [Moorena sp. SIO3B2]|uniref:hypothetical protein n=1 Tax=Moorena sp. SIO3B2 TaxID=2607827 RepID=UPI0013C9C403|nr:hypothetical protein [Moorena sp. SIO3B2]NEP36685.1 hypothetical protein [Moorena sp. SIO3B2]